MRKDAHIQGRNWLSGRARTGGIGSTNHSHHNIAAERFNICKLTTRQTPRNAFSGGKEEKYDCKVNICPVEKVNKNLHREAQDQ